MIDVAAASAGVDVTTLLRRIVLPAVRREVERAAAGLEQALNEHERREVRAGLWLRRQELERLQKTVARSGLAAATRELESRLELVDALLRATATEEELAELDGRDPRQLEIPAAGVANA